MVKIKISQIDFENSWDWYEVPDDIVFDEELYLSAEDPIKLAPSSNSEGKYSISDGTHRIKAMLNAGIEVFDAIIETF